MLGPLSRITNGRSLAAKMKSDGEGGGEGRGSTEGERGEVSRGREEVSEEKGRPAGGGGGGGGGGQQNRKLLRDGNGAM